jgi:tetratricopeptide (TPR) repeat protein
MRRVRFAAILSFLAAVFLARGAVETAAPVELLAARRLRQEMRYEDAKRMFAAWLRTHPDDAQAHFDYGYTLFLQAAAEKNESNATALRKAAHAEGATARKLGCTDALTDLLLSAVDENGADLRNPRQYSTDPEAAKRVEAAEQAYAAHKLDEALALYQQALQLDPRCYHAALFSGDVYFSRADFGKAIEWFSKAVAIDPDRETAFRYWGDALMRTGRVSEAHERYIAAVIAEPYNRLPREMLARYATAIKAPLQWPAIALPRVEVALKNGKPEVAYDPASGPLILAYALARAKWLTDEREKFFPKNAEPRHSLMEECAGLRAFVAVGTELSENNADAVKPLAGTLAGLKELDAAGLLEAYVLFERADAGIVQDYPAYRQEHRDKLETYARSVWFRPRAAERP